MQSLQSIDLTFNFNGWYLVLLLVLAAAYTVWNYRVTVPPVGGITRSLLMFLRFSALAIILLIFFEPVLVLNNKITETPQNLVFFDNSSSIAHSEDSARVNEDLISELKNLPGKNLLYTFSSKPEPLAADNKISFNGTSTNFEELLSTVKNTSGPLASIIIVSDGIITEGENPLNQFEEAGVPVFSVGIGDTTEIKDVSVNRILHNEFIYANAPTTITAEILNIDMSPDKINVSLYEGDKRISSQIADLNSTGINRVSFNYQSDTPGEKKITVETSILAEEGNKRNNRRETYIKVSESKLNVFIVAGAPSSDLAFVKNALRTNENIRLTSYVEIAPGINQNENSADKNLDSADVIVLIGYPAKQSPAGFMQKMLSTILEKNIPVLQIFSETYDFNKMIQFKEVLPFTINRIGNGSSLVQPNIINPNSPVIKSGITNDIQDWENLPPVPRSNTEITPLPGSDVLANIKIRNTPLPQQLIILNSLGEFKKAAISAGQIWRWKLQAPEKSRQLFDNFINSLIKWLSTDENNKRVFVSPAKKIFYQGEKIIFNSQVFNELLEPVTDAEITVDISGENYKNSINLMPVETGIYEGELNLNIAGDYSYTAEIKMSDGSVKSVEGRFSVSKINAEELNLKQNVTFLKALAGRTGGEYIKIQNSGSIAEKYSNRISTTEKIRYEKDEIVLWSDIWLLLIAILLLSVEWIIRKRAGMM